MRFFKTTVPTGTPAWSLWLSGSTREIAVRKSFVPFHTGSYDRKQAGQMLVVAPYLTGSTSTYFLSVVGTPGDVVTLDSRIQEVQTLAFNSSGSAVTVPDRPYRVYRVQVPVQQIAWDVAVTPTAGDANVCVRRDNVPAEFDNDAFSEVPGLSTDSITLVPDFLTDATWFITVSGNSPYTFSLRNGPPTITTLGFNETKLNDQTTRAGWRFYAMNDVPSQLGSLGWELNLANQVPGTEIAIRRNAVPSRWRSRSNGSTGIGSDGRVDASGTGGFLQRPSHQADIWYVGIYTPSQALGAFTLTSGPITPAPMRFDPASAGPDPSTWTETNQSPGQWRFTRIEVPAGVLGWDLRLRGVSGAVPTMVVRRDQLPQDTGTTLHPGTSPWSSPSSSTAWQSGNQWAASTSDWTGWSYDLGAPTYQLARPRLVMAMGRPLEAGTYYVGVYNSSPTSTSSYTLDSRGIGAGQIYPLTATLAYAGGAATISNLTPREAQYFKVTIPANTPSWEVTLAPTTGEMLLAVRRGTVPDFNASPSGDASGEIKMQKAGPERYVMLPQWGQDSIVAGDYYLAVVSEGVNPNGSVIGTGTSSGILTSLGPLAIANLGTASAAGSTQAVALVGGQLKAYQFTVPVGTASLEVRLDNRVGNPEMVLAFGSRFPDAGSSGYGLDGGGSGSSHDSILTVANPAPGSYSLVVHAESVSSAYPDASANLVIIANAPIPLAFDAATSVVANQSPGAWRYFQVTVPAGVLGWDLRLRDVSWALPTMVVRRDQLPNDTSTTTYWTGTSSYVPPSYGNGWPSGNQWAASTSDWTGWYYDLGAPTYQPTRPRLVMAMGRPLEAGTYYVGVYNSSTTSTSSYTLDSRGIGAGQTYPLTATLAYAGGTATISNLAPREAQYYKVTIPANTLSWEVKLEPTTGEMALLVRSGAIPDFNDSGNASYGVKMQKAGPERYVMLPESNLDYIPAGDYYLAVVSEGVNPNPGSNSVIGTGTSSGILTSLGPLAVTALGAATNVGLTAPVTLASGQIKAFTFTVPPSTNSLEVRLANTTGAPSMQIYPGTRIPSPYGPPTYSDYGTDGGGSGHSVAPIFTRASPTEGIWTVVIQAGGSGLPAATADMVFRTKPNVPLNFDISLNSGGGTHTDTRQMTDGEYTVYQVSAPATVGGQPVTGWVIKTDVLQGAVSLEVYKNIANPSSGIAINGGFAVIVPPYLTLGDTWYVRVKATGLTNYTITSRPVTLERPVWQMPPAHNLTFGDSGNDSGGAPLPGDRGVDLGQGEWHFYAVDVSTSNAGLLRTELQAISGNPDLFVREDGVPTTDHDSNGSLSGGSTLYQRSLTGSITEYGNWVPLDGRTQSQLTPGRWYIGVKAAGNSNVRYRLSVSTGQVTDLALNGGSLANQTLPDNDWRYYRFTVPENAPANWALTFSQQVGDVVMWLRDSLPPGQRNYSSNSSNSIASWYTDSKNQGPYSYDGHDAPDTYEFATPPLRPGHTYYAGFRSNNSATFSVSSATSGGTIGTFTDLDYYTGSINTSIAAGGSVIYRIPVPPEATRMKWTTTNPTSVQLRLEQGTLPGTTGTQHWTSSSSANVAFNQSLTNANGWPWQANQHYYLRVMNTSAAAQNVVLTMSGKNAATEDEDNDGLPDQWEIQYFTYNSSYTGTSDPDGDGVTNAVEFVDGTIPNNVNSAKYFLTLNAYNGSATKTPELPKYDRGTVVTPSNTPTAGHAFLGWQRVGSYADDFAMEVTGTVTIPTDGVYTFGINAADGARLKVNNVAVITDDSTHSVADRFGQITLTAGTYPLELRAFEYSGGEALELFAAAGRHASFNSSFKLLGDTANGGLLVQTTSGGGTVSGMSLRQVIGVGTGNIYNLSQMDGLMAGTRAKRAETGGIVPVINHLGSASAEGRFVGNVNFPLQQPQTGAPFELGMYGDYVLAGLNSAPLTDAVDAPALTFTQSGEAPWLGELSAQAQDNVDHAGSGPISHSQSSSFSTTVVGPGTLTFRWKVSSEATNDQLQFLVNGTVNQQISGEQSYPLVTYAMPSGPQTLTWRYKKNATVTSGSDRGWVDQINFEQTRYTLTINAAGGAVNVSPQQADYQYGTVVTLTPSTIPGNTFTGWAGALTGAANPATLTMDANKAVTASFSLAVAPTVTNVTPASGSTSGGTSVTITGTGFTGATGVTIGGTAATGMTVVNATTITATTPAGTAGTASVVVTTPGGSNSANSLYTYVILIPTVTASAPNALTTGSATLNGTVNPNGFPTTAHFEYGLTTSYGTQTNVTLSPTDGSTVQNVSANISGLTPGTLYHYRLSATHSGGTAVTTNGSFTTLTASQAVVSAMAAAGLSGPNAALDATPHHDGVENLLKYAFNMNLSGPDSATMPAGGGSGLPGITTQPNGASSIFRFEFLRRKNSGLIYTPQKSGDLTNSNSWVPLVDTPTVTSIDTNWERVIYEEPYNAATTPKCFGRVEVSLP